MPYLIVEVKQGKLKDGKEQLRSYSHATGAPRCRDYVRNKVFAIDFDETSVRVARCLNLVAGDGQTNVLHTNTLDWPKWDERIRQDEDWQETYGPGWAKLKKLRQPKNQNRTFGFDVLMANPPLAGTSSRAKLPSRAPMPPRCNTLLHSTYPRTLRRDSRPLLAKTAQALACVARAS